MDIIEELYKVILDRKHNPNSESYVSELMTAGEEKIIEKVLEEAEEVIEAARVGSKEDLIHEVADLIFHLLVLLGFKDVTPGDIKEEMKKRRK